MPSRYAMEYCPQFPKCILLLKVCCVRVTHPFAAMVLLPPLDLHVLGLPLAFILSQDQTLHDNFIFDYTNLTVKYMLSSLF
jgi:hypothetical protein